MVWALVLTVAVKMDDVWILRNQGVTFLSCLIAGFDLINTASSAVTTLHANENLVVHQRSQSFL